MKSIKIDLPKELEFMELHVFADEHMGDPHSDAKRLLQRIEDVKNTPHAYCILNGDIIDNATKTSIGDTYAQELNPMDQLTTAAELFEPIKDKILCITHGNHENRTYKKEGINLSYLLAAQLGLTERYTPTSAIIFLRLGSGGSHGGKIRYTIYALHGSGGGRKEGAKAIRLGGHGQHHRRGHLHTLTHAPAHGNEASLPQGGSEKQHGGERQQAVRQYGLQPQLRRLRRGGRVQTIEQGHPCHLPGRQEKEIRGEAIRRRSKP